ncbi:IucA/IucC family C-terminal-domain containing protein [Halalkalibacter alkalisediminis]|uniref:IucA/IucC family C-terminal-domain containing protein n=1 Tax=Halalkalibacter alkalisediminis TaxID=935616 RepID=A0ABV6NIK1_9BACI|nr:IucA/IucC family C-terminal-domain containing protein [Halalkalibacter alkalisediminis]
MRKCSLQTEDRLLLENYRICFKDEQRTSYMDVNDILDQDKLSSFLTWVQNELQAPDLLVAASAFSKRYSYLMVVPALFTFSLLNKQLNMSVSNLSLLSSISENKWLPRLFIKDPNAFLFETDQERAESRDKLIETIFAHHLSPLWDRLSVISKIPQYILWENTAVYLFWVYESLLNRADLTANDRVVIKSDFNYIIYEAHARLFGCFTKDNPFETYYNHRKKIDGTYIRIRKTCCFSYKLSADLKMCNSCPKKDRC